MAESTALISGVISLIVSAGVAIFTGDRWVERAQRKQAHSKQFIDIITRFFTSFDSVFPIESKLDYESFTFVDPIINGFDGVDQGKYLEEHIRSGYPKVVLKLDEYIVAHNNLINLNKQIKNDISEIIVSTVNDANIPLYVPGYFDHNDYFNLEHYMLVFCNQLGVIVKGRGDPSLSRMETQVFESDNSIHVSWDSYGILNVQRDDQATAIKARTVMLVNSESIQSMFIEYHAELDVLQELRHQFALQLTEIKNLLDMVNVIEGRCSACPHGRFY